MNKNVINPISLLCLIIIIALTSCSTQKTYTYHSKSKNRTERSHNTKERKKISKPEYVGKSASQRNSIVSTARQYLGKEYKYGGKNPSSGFDCSGFISHVYQQNGVNISGPSYSQAKKGRAISRAELKEGDLIFFGRSDKVTHVAIVANVNQDKLEVIHSTSSRGVVIDDISASDYWQSRYLFGRDILN